MTNGFKFQLFILSFHLMIWIYDKFNQRFQMNAHAQAYIYHSIGWTLSLCYLFIYEYFLVIKVVEGLVRHAFHDIYFFYLIFYGNYAKKK